MHRKVKDVSVLAVVNCDACCGYSANDLIALDQKIVQGLIGYFILIPIPRSTAVARSESLRRGRLT